jgi:glutaminase
MLDYNEILNKTFEKISNLEPVGQVASYIPELAKTDPNTFGVHLLTTDNRNYSIGCNDRKFSVQSIVKVLSLTYALELQKEDIWKRVNMEPSGNPFNSVVQLEYEHGIPRNPFINAGALVICDILYTHLHNPEADFLNFVKKLCHNRDISYNRKIAKSEKVHGYRNYALANFMKAYGNIHNNINDLMDFYFCICSLELSCEDLANSFIVFAKSGKLLSGEQIISRSKSKRINALMQTCGFYDESGLFSYRVGLPGKSGVGGGIIAVHPGLYSIAVWSPRLNDKGNSYLGLKFLEEFTTLSGVSIF